MDLNAGLSSLSQPTVDLLTRLPTARYTEMLAPSNIPILQRQVHLTKDEIDQLVADYQAGRSLRQLVRTYAVNRTTVLDHLERNQPAERVVT